MSGANTYICPECPETFRELQEWYDHRREEHKGEQTTVEPSEQTALGRFEG